MNLSNIAESDALRKFTCHKTVRAAKITSVGARRASGRSLILEGGYDLQLSADEDNRLLIQEGGYLVVYENGYVSFSPGEVFETGYAPADSEPDTGNDAEDLDMRDGGDAEPRSAEELLAEHDELVVEGEDGITLEQYRDTLTDSEDNILTHALSDRAQAANED